MHYAKTKASFEEVTLKFMGIEEKNALTNYLKKKLESLRASEKTQITLIVLWLLEIYQEREFRISYVESHIKPFGPSRLTSKQLKSRLTTLMIF